MNKKERFDIIRLIIGIIITIPLIICHFIFGENLINGYKVNLIIILPISLVLFLFLTFDLFIKLIQNIKHKDFFDETTLTLIASIAAFVIGEYVEALAVILFFQLGEKFEEYAVNKSRKSIKDVLDLKSDHATLIKDNKEIVVDPYDVEIDDIILVKSGEKVPLDGIIIKGSSFIDTSFLTGESVPRKVKENDEILSGVINKGSPIYIKVTKMFYDSTVSKIMDLVENATNNKTKNERFITKFSKYYTPIVCLIALLVAIIPPLIINYSDLETWKDFIYNAATILVVSCPCALVLSVPMAYFVGIGEASKVKMIIKGSSYLESLSKLDTVVLDKTGTITKGNFVIDKIISYSSKTNDEILYLARVIESKSLHPIASSILENFDKSNLDLKNLSSLEEIEGKGIKGVYKNQTILVGNSNLFKDFNIEIPLTNDVGTLVYVGSDTELFGLIVIKDEIKKDSLKSIPNFKKIGIKNTYMLTGDNYEIAKDIATTLNIDNVKANLLPQDKLNELNNLIDNKNNKMVAFVGDGVNDAPSMTSAPLGISMGNIGSDAAIEASDIVIMDDKLSTLIKGKRIARKTVNIVYQNIIFALLIKAIAIVLTSTNLLGSYAIWLGIFADVGVTILCVLNSFRIMIKRKNINNKDI